MLHSHSELCTPIDLDTYNNTPRMDTLGRLPDNRQSALYYKVVFFAK